MDDRVLSLNEFTALPEQEQVPMAAKPVISLADFDRIGGAEHAVKDGIDDGSFALERALFDAMSKGSQTFTDNLVESFKIGDESSKLDMMGYGALSGEFDYHKDIKPIRDAFNKRLAERPKEDHGVLSNAIYTVAGMVPAMGKGYLEGLQLGSTVAVGSALMGPAGVAAAPAAFAAGTQVGSLNYWYRQGAGSLYMDLKEADIDDAIAVPTSHIAGALYGAIEFSQVAKLIPGSKEATKKLITRGVKRTVARLVMKHGVNWVQEVGEEGMQEAVMSLAKDISSEIAGKTNRAAAEIAERALASSLGVMKDSALPMMLMLGPSAGVDAKRVYDDQRAFQQAEIILSEAEKEAMEAKEEEAEDPDAVAAQAVQEALDEAQAEGEAEEPVQEGPSEQYGDQGEAISEEEGQGAIEPSEAQEIANLRHIRDYLEADTTLYEEAERAEKIANIDAKIKELEGRGGQVKFSRADQVNSPAFKAWFGDSKVVDENGNPLVVYHGTTHDFNEFKKDRSNIENYYGRVYYFTDSRADVEANYAGVGPDLQQRIELRAEKIFQDMFVGKDEPKWNSKEHKSAMMRARNKARKELKGAADGRIIEAYLSLKNPVILTGDKQTRFQIEFNEETETETGSGLELYNAVLQAADERGLDGQEIWGDVMQNLEPTDFSAAEFEEAMRASEKVMYIEDDDGALASNDFISDVYSNAGFDGVIMDADTAFGTKRKTGKKMTMDEGTKHYIAFDATQIKSVDNTGTFDPTNPDIRFSRAANFYSQLDRVISEKMPNAASPEQIMGILKNSGVKQEEIDWLGVDEFLEGKEKVSKAELLDFIRANNVKIEEVVKGGQYSEMPDSALEDFRNKAAEELFGEPIKYENLTKSEKADVDMRAEQDFNDSEKLTKFSQYQLPGGENYKELLLTLPVERKTIDELGRELYENFARKGGEPAWEELSDTEKASYNSTAQINLKNFGTKHTFTSSHFDEPNVLAHVRFNERTDAEGKRVLFIEEIQSDWHQKGRKEGYGTDLSKWKAVETEPSPHSQWPQFKITDQQGRNAGTWGAENAKEAIEMASKNAESYTPAVPNAPFKKTWHELALKRMLRYAAEKGFDKIAWTTGEQQAERYDLSERVDAVFYTKHGDGRYSVGFGIEGQRNPVGVYEAAKLPDIVGKEVAQKIIDGAGKEISHKGTDAATKELTGVDLKVGGEGMKGFYDQIIPAFLNKYTKKWGGKVVETNIGQKENQIPIPADKADELFQNGSDIYAYSPENGYYKVSSREEIFAAEDDKIKLYKDALPDPGKVHSLEITPAMREALMQPQPKFSRGDGGRMTKEAVSQVVKTVSEKLKNLPGIEVVQTIDEARAIFEGTPDDAEAFFDPRTQTIVLIADNLTDEKRTHFVIFHEAAGHFGLNGIFGQQKLSEVMGQIYDTHAEIRRAAEQKIAMYGYSKAVAVEEVLADMAEAGENVSLLSRIIAFIRQAFRDLGFEVGFTDADIRAILANSLRYVEQAPKEPGQANEIGDVYLEYFGQAPEPVYDDLQRISETDEFRQKGEQVAELQSIIDEVRAKIEAASDIGKIKIRRFKGDYLAEELRAIPKKYFTSDPNAPALDELADEWGVSMDQAIQILKDNTITRADIKRAADARHELKMIESAMRRKNPVIKEAVESITRKAPKLKLTQSQIIKRLFQARFKGQKEGYREGRAAGRQEVMTAKKILDRRRERIKGLADMLNLSDSDMRRINRRDIRLMSNHEFKQFIDKLEAMAAGYAAKRQLKNQALFEIQDKRLRGVENLQRSLKMPPLDKMSVDQLKELVAILEKAQADDEFLSTRKLETVKNTELAGIRTIREAREILAKKLGVDLKSIENLQVSQIDKLRFDAALADANPFYALLVDETNKNIINAETRFLEMDQEVDELARKARASRSMTLADRIAPTDELVFQWMETPDAKKAAVESKMTKEELALAQYLKTRFNQFREYLVKAEVLKHFKLDYITHVRRGFFEAWKKDGVLEAFKEFVQSKKEDQQMFQILDEDTQNILPLEKFFQFAMHRSGKLKATQNVAKAFKVYAKAMTKKQALDRIIPAMEIYAYALSPKKMTPRGLQMNRKLIQFTREWINNKKGRKSSLGGLIPQGGAIDLALRGFDAVITGIDLGFSIPVGLTVNIGEQMTEFVNLGSKKYTLGLKRLNTEKGRELVKKYEAFVGKSPWRGLADTADGLADKFHKAMFMMFETATVRANKVHLLGSMTAEEYEFGIISDERLAQLRRDIGRWRHVNGAKSIFGSTSAGSALTKYKSWAIPIFWTTVRDVSILLKMLARGDGQKAMQSREFHELFRAAMLTTTVALVGRALVGDDDDDDSFLGEIIRKSYRESLSLIGALDLEAMSKVRLTSFLTDLLSSVKMIMTLEEYKTKPGLKGVGKLKRTITPKAVRQFVRDEDKDKNNRIRLS